MSSYRRFARAGLAAIALAALTACGGGGGGGGGGGSSTGTGGGTGGTTTDPVSKSFSVSVASMTVDRLSNGEQVTVDTSEVASGELTYEP